MATGTYLNQLLAACLSETMRTAINAGLTTASLTTIASGHLLERPVGTTSKLKPPTIEVGLAPSRNRYTITADPTAGRIEEVEVEFVVSVYEQEATAVSYEGVIAEAILGQEAVLEAAVTDAALGRWELSGGEADVDEDTRNKDAWSSRIRFRAQIEVR